jgi:hypothetical protein
MRLVLRETSQVGRTRHLLDLKAGRVFYEERVNL